MRGSAGGRARAIVSRREALERYYSNPSICKHCCKIIEVLDNQRIADVRVKKFCNKSCAASYNNLIPKRTKSQRVQIWKDGKRLPCKCGGIKSYGATICKMCQFSGGLENATKGDLFANRKNWQSARSNIQRHARKIYFKYNDNPKCAVCGYTKHVEVCHKKDVSSFSNDSLIKEINDINNLIGLCPNHHWEFDNGMMD